MDSVRDRSHSGSGIGLGIALGIGMMIRAMKSTSVMLFLPPADLVGRRFSFQAVLTGDCTQTGIGFVTNIFVYSLLTNKLWDITLNWCVKYEAYNMLRFHLAPMMYEYDLIRDVIIRFCSKSFIRSHFRAKLKFVAALIVYSTVYNVCNTSYR